MATIKRNRIDGYELIVTPNFIRETEPVIVEGLAAGDDLLWRAVQQGGIPQPGDPHSYLPNCKVAEIKGRVIDTTTAHLTITSESVDAETQPPIGSGDGWVISNDVSLVQAQSEIDRDGRPFVVSWEVKGSSKGYPDRVARAPVYIAMRTMTASTTRTSIPPDQWYSVTNCVNGQAWCGGHRGEWLFAGVKDSTRDGGKTYSVQLTFIHNPESWVTVALYYDEHGQPVAISDQDAARAKNGVYERWKGNGISKYTFYREADFASIFNLSIR